jgi:hypothetical protein
MKIIKLTRGYETIVDAQDYAALTTGWRWYAAKRSNSHGTYAIGRRPEMAPRVIGMSRVITDCPRGMVVDHINHDTLDNRRCNLRICTHGQNMANRRPTPGRLKGVIMETDCVRRWRAYMAGKNGSVSLGTYASPEEAARAYDRAVIARYGEFACTNFPRSDYENEAA